MTKQVCERLFLKCNTGCLHGLGNDELREQTALPQMLNKKKLPEQQRWCAKAVLSAGYGLERHDEAVRAWKSLHLCV